MIPSFTMIGLDPEFEKMSREIEEYAYDRRKTGNEDEKSEKIKDLYSKIEKVCSLAMKELQQELNTLKVN